MITATYQKINGAYHIELINSANGEFEGGGSTGCTSYNEAYNFASKVAATKLHTLGRFRKGRLS